MRRYQIRKTEELVATLIDACDELKKCKAVEFLSLCADIQEFVEATYNYVGESVREPSIGGALREKLSWVYKELYISSNKQQYTEKIDLILQEIVSFVKNLVANEIEIAFFCYKASMSDCFESIYFASQKDDNCKSFFIPIPYFDKKEDGSIGEMYYEGKEYYSDRYEITDWREYDVETRHPDVIFIMNPYDMGNHVSTVHPDYYSKRLRECTDRLVYVEYGLPLWLCKNPLADVTLTEHYLPAHIYCHTYIAFSKWVKEYFDTMFDVNGDLKTIQKALGVKREEKFVELGSPKFDKVLNCQRNVYVIPDEWKAKVSDRKVILYNCSINELLSATSGADEEANSKYLDKLEKILNIYTENNNIVLWWRPHPLFEKTLNSLRPKLVEKYKAIVDDFKTKPNGIFDDSSDLHRAIAYSDGMVSDESSLLWLYLATGKPFYIPSISKALHDPVVDGEDDFCNPINDRLKLMRNNPGAYIEGTNVCLWWDVFDEDYLVENIRYANFEKRFMDYVLHPDKYPQAEEYKSLQIQMFKDFVANPDGTAGEKIYRFVKERALS